jgi:hypothetical protein
VPVGVSAGAHQDHVEDCPVCCHPIALHVDIATDGEAVSVGVCFGSFGGGGCPQQPVESVSYRCVLWLARVGAGRTCFADVGWLLEGQIRSKQAGILPA